MGQRLNIEIHNKDGILANAYYHWSGYSLTAYNLTESIVAMVTKWRSKIKNDMLFAVGLLEATGAGIPKEELEFLRTSEWCAHMSSKEWSKIIFKPGVDRNAGLIAVSPKGVERTRFWEEGRVTINIDTKEVNFNVYWEYDEETFKERFPAMYENPVGIAEIKDFQLDKIPFNSISRLKSLMESEDSNEGIKLPKGKIILWLS